MQAKITPEELRQRVDADYFGLRDEDDGLILQYELSQSRLANQKLLTNASEAAFVELEKNFIAEPEPATPFQIEEWLLRKRRLHLEEKYLPKIST
jgi:pre-mRNA-splicing factor ISY1